MIEIPSGGRLPVLTVELFGGIGPVDLTAAGRTVDGAARGVAGFCAR